jgi:cation diffusion facilitator CzcD-associated flavoprotein CzcO
LKSVTVSNSVLWGSGRGPAKNRTRAFSISGVNMQHAAPRVSGYPGKPTLPRVCIIGAGCAGFTTAKRLKDHGIGYDCFEMSDDVGGNWYYRNPNGRSACYASLHIDTSKWRLAFEDFPVPEHFPDFPHHSELLAYFRAYVDHFGLRETITFNTEVTKAHRRDDGLWAVTVSNGQTRLYDALIVANGHHWNPRWPDPYPGTFAGHQFHAHDYRDPFDPMDMRGKRVVVVGAGNSAMDIASELSQRSITGRLFISMRRGVWVLPKYMNGKPSDKAALPSWLPLSVGRALAGVAVKKAVGPMERYGLPKPDHEPLTGHPSVSGEFLTRVGCGDIIPKPAIASLDGDHVVFADGSREAADVIIYATGYHLSFPFFDQDRFEPKNNALPLWKRMMQPGVDNLFFMGLAQPLPTLVNLPEQQAKLVAAYLTGMFRLPEPDAMRAQIEADEKVYLGHFYDSPRHTIQIDFAHYVRALRADLIKRRATGEALPVRPRAVSMMMETV